MVPFPSIHRHAVLRFGRRQPFTYAMPADQAGLGLADDAKLFLTTFVGGLLFMSVYLA